ncbi:kinase-like domain-containing protein [Rhizophagus clarus]|uniref:Kinase-like domain-containing protein n=1 Tax=Rhizophagus clarus TaxID=94130 RepID=A0A8H3L970_9GLOM|nr:kinase-like domain-containing protein [Rhizophagus clarus]
MDPSKFWVDFTNGKEIITKNFTNWTSGNEMIDNFIQEMQLNYDGCGKLFEWVPYNELIIDKKIEDNYLTRAIWKKGSLYYDKDCGEIGEWIRESYETVTLRFLYDSQNITDEFINKFKSYLNDESCGITQNPYTKVFVSVSVDDYFNNYVNNKYRVSRMLYKSCEKNLLKNLLKNNFTNWTSGNEKIDDFIQEKQLNYNGKEAVFEWIPYDDLFITEVIRDNWLATAIWKDGPSIYDHSKKKLIKKSCEAVCLRYLHNSLVITNNFLNEIESYLKYNWGYGLSQNPDTKVYILVFSNKYFNKCCDKCVCLRYLYNSPYITNEFLNEVESYLKDGSGYGLSQNPDTKVYILIFSNEYFEKCCDKCAIWKDGPLIYDDSEKKLIRKSFERVYLKYLHNSLNIIEFLNKNIYWDGIGSSLYGLSQNPETEVYILVLYDYPIGIYCGKCFDRYNNKYEWCEACQINNLKNDFTNWTSGDDKIDNFIQERQSMINEHYDTIFEWISYNEFIDIKEIDRESGFATAIWKDGPLYYSIIKRKYRRKINEKVLLKYMHNLQNVESFLNEVTYSIEESHGVSQNPNTKDFILVLQTKYYCEHCVYYGKSYWKRKPNIKVALKCLHNSQNFLDEFINEVKAYSNQRIGNILKIYGISQNPKTKDYIMVLEYAEGGSFNTYLNENYKNFDWFKGLRILIEIIKGLNKIHHKKMVHQDFHIGNILFTKIEKFYDDDDGAYFEDTDDSTDEDDNANNDNDINDYYRACISDMGLCKKIDDNDETKIYGVMPYVAPEVLKGKPYTQAADIYSFEQFKKTHVHRTNFLSNKSNRSTIHTQAVYTSRLLNSFTGNLSKYDNIDNNTVEITDFTNF